MSLSFFRNCRALIEQERERATTDEAPNRREYSSARSRQFQMHLNSMYFKTYTYPGVHTRHATPPCTGLRARKFVGDKRCWYVVNHSGPVEGGKGRRIVAPPWFLFNANPMNHDLVYQRFLCCFLPPFFFFCSSSVFRLLSFCLLFAIYRFQIIYQICKIFLTIWLHWDSDPLTLSPFLESNFVESQRLLRLLEEKETWDFFSRKSVTYFDLGWAVELY